MRLNVSAWAIRKPIPSIVLFIVLMALGIFSFRQLPITRFPNIDIPIVSITVTQSGAAPSELQNQVTKRVEDAVAGVNGVKHIISTIAEGLSTTTIEFRLEINSDRAVNDVKDAIAKIRADLPRTIDEPIVQRVEIAGLPIVTYAASNPAMTPEELSWFVDDVVARQLQSLAGVGGVTRVGGVDREIRVTLDVDRLLALGITAADVNRQLRLTSVDLAGGRGEIGGQEQSIRALGSAQTLETLSATNVILPAGRRVRLDELATVTDAAAEPRTYARFNGEPVVAFAVSRATGASDATVGAAVAAKVGQVAARASRHPLRRHRQLGRLHGRQLPVGDAHPHRRGRARRARGVHLPQGLARDPHHLARPAALGAADLLDHGDDGLLLNLVSLLAITLVTGILVDDAIVEIENIVRHMRMGKSPYRAALEAADEIGLAVIAITFTIVAVFAPVSFMGGIAGQYFKQFGLTVAAAVLISLLVARLVTPMLAAYFMRPHKHEEEADGFIMRAYTRLVGWSVRHKFVTFILGLGFFAGSIMSTGLLPSGFLPEEDVSRSLFVMELPPGARLDDTRAETDGLTERLRRMPEVQSVFVNGGTQLPGKKEVRLATVTVNFVPKEDRTLRQRQLENRIIDLVHKEVPDVRFYRLNENGQRGLQLIVAGPDQDLVIRTAAKLEREMATIPTLESAVSTIPLNRAEIRIRPKAALAAELGVSTDVIAETVRVATIGDVGANLAKFDAGDRQVPIRVQLPDAVRADRALLDVLKVPAKNGAAVPLSAVADIELGQGPTSIDRYDRSLRIALEGDMRGTDALGEVIDAVMKLPTAQNLPPGISIRQTGDAEIMTEVFSGFGKAMGAGVMMVLGVLILLFANFLQPFTILLSLPLSIGGAILALVITQNAISLPVVIGFLMLMGIVTKNAIMLVDFAVEEVSKGVDRVDAIVDAGRKRARPIVMTTIAMAAGMLPSALALGAGGEFRAPMAIAVIGGLIVSTMLSLVFVPAFFILMDDLSRFLSWAFGRFVGPSDEATEEDTFIAARLGHEVKAYHQEPLKIAAE